MSGDMPTTIHELRVQVANGAARGEHVFTRTLTTSPGPLTPADSELNLMAHYASFYGYSLCAVLELIATREPELREEVLALVNDIGADGDDGRSADIWPQVQERLGRGGVGTPAWDARIAAQAAQ